jgi:hypothetical protein
MRSGLDGDSGPAWVFKPNVLISVPAGKQGVSHGEEAKKQLAIYRAERDFKDGLIFEDFLKKFLQVFFTPSGAALIIVQVRREADSSGFRQY